MNLRTLSIRCLECLGLALALGYLALVGCAVLAQVAQAAPVTAGPRAAFAPVAAPAAASPAVAAADTPDTQAAAIHRTALDFLKQQTVGLPGKTEIDVKAVAPRGLAPCDALTAFLPPGARLWGRTTVGVRCAGERPWTLYLQARIAVHATYYVASRQIDAGQTVVAEDLVAREGDLTSLPQAIITDAAQAIGAVAQSRITAGLPLRRDLLRAAIAVQQGQTVKLIAQGQGFSITTDGSAMANAAAGQQVRVKTRSGQIVSGVVKGNDTVEIAL